MIYRNSAIKTAIVAATCLLSLDAFAGNTQYDNEFSLGLMGLSGTNANQAGRYDGLNTTGASIVGQYSYSSRSPDNAGGTKYFNSTGTNLVFQTGSSLGNHENIPSNATLNNGSLSFDFGQQGTWAANLGYDAITYTGNLIDSIYSVNGSQATLNPGLTAWGGATSSTAGTPSSALTIPALDASGAMRPVQVGTRRDRLGGSFKYLFNDWTFTGAVHSELKKGSLEKAFDGPWGGTAFASPIDFRSDRYDLTATHMTRENQLSLQYTFNQFTDGNRYVNLPYPYSNTSAPYQLSGAYSTPPNNTAQYLTLMEANNSLLPKTRLNANLRVGLEQQDNEFPPNTGDPNPGSAAADLNSNMQGTTANSPDDRAKVIQGKLSAYSHLATNTNLDVYYGYDRRMVSLNQYEVNIGGHGGSNDSALSGDAYVVPQDWLKQNLGVNVGYLISPQSDTKVTASYRHDDIKRSNAQVGSSRTNTESIKLLSSLGPVLGRFTYEHSDRNGTLTYETAWDNLDPSGGAAYSGAYYQAPMKSNGVNLMLTYSKTAYMSANLYLEWKKENYTYPQTTALTITGVGGGIKNDRTLVISPSVNYRPSDKVSLNAFYSYEQIYFDNLGNGQCANSNTGNCAGSAGYFENKYTSDIDTVGLNGHWKASDKLTLGAEYTHSSGAITFGEYDGVFVTNPTQDYQNVTNYPDINSRMDNLKLTAKYKLTSKADLMLQAIWSHYTDNNWYDDASSIQGAGSNSVSILTPGYSSPNYNVRAIMVGARMQF